MNKQVIYPNFYHDFAQPAMLALARAGNRGCLVDVPFREKLTLEAQVAETQAQQALNEALGTPVNCNSPKQIKELLYDNLKLPVQYKRGVGGGPQTITADEEAIKKLRRNFPSHANVLNLILDVRGFSKEASGLQAVLEHKPEGQVFVTSYNATGTVTGRISSSETILGLGGNLQNQKRGRSRRMFIARPGMTFVKADGSQAEARVVAALCGDVKLLKLFDTPGWDTHTTSAQIIYGGTTEEIEAEDRAWKAGTLGSQKDSKRQRSKYITHGANYQGGPNIAVKHGDIPYAEAKAGLEKYLRSRPLLRSWWDRVALQVTSTRRLQTVWGRIRYFFSRIDDGTFREATAQEPQSTVGDLINHAFFRLDGSLELLSGWPLLQAHDEIVAEVPNARVSEAVDLVRAEFEYPLPFETGPLVIPAEIAIGRSWGELEKVK